MSHDALPPSLEEASSKTPAKIKWILIVAAITGFGTFINEVQDLSDSPAKQFTKAWRADLDMLAKKKKLPSAFSELKNVNIQAGDAGGSEILKETTVPLKFSSRGTYNLDVLITTWKTDAQWGAIVQYDLIDKTGNTIWEVGRTFTMNGSPPEKAGPLQEEPKTRSSQQSEK